MRSLVLFLAVAVSSAVVAETTVPTQFGEASYYHDRKTASGEHFDPEALTCAHRSLNFDTNVRVINLHNGRSVICRINDRGPFKRNRIIDLSMAGARAIGMIESGVVPVALEVIE